jgi:hypothetical protein
VRGRAWSPVISGVHAGFLGAAGRDGEVLLLAGISHAGGYHIALALGVPSIGLVLHPQTGGFHDRGSLRPISAP